MPLIGLGTKKEDNEYDHIRLSVKNGYRLFDTASCYENEEIVGKALNDSISEGLVKREDLFVITKMWCDEHEDPESAIKNSLKRLNLDYVDLYLQHFP